MKTIELPIPEGYKAEWVDGVLTLLPEINIGDTVTADRDICFYALDNFHIAKAGTPLKVTGYAKYICTLEHDGAATTADVRCLKPMEEAAPEPQDITERIKTFEDAVEWCKKNRVAYLGQYKDAINVGLQRAPDILAYLKLRIITCALNEGWEPTFSATEHRYVPNFTHIDYDKDAPIWIISNTYYGDSSAKLCFKSKELANYAAIQFRDIYADFCGCKEGGEK